MGLFAAGLVFGPISRAADPGAGAQKRGAFLGVATSPVTEAMGAQLGLPEGVGLVVVFVSPDSPASKALRKHDVLHKLGDQILTDQRQLAVLVRMRKPDDEVSISILRTGRSMEVKVVLEERELSPLTAFGGPRLPVRLPPPVFAPYGAVKGEHGAKPRSPVPSPHNLEDRLEGILKDTKLPKTQIEEILEQLRNGLRQAPGAHGAVLPGMPAGGTSSVSAQAHNQGGTKTRAATFSLIDGNGRRAVLTLNDDQRRLLLVAPDGSTVYDGLPEQAAQPGAVPDSFRALLENVRDNAARAGMEIGPPRHAAPPKDRPGPLF